MADIKINGVTPTGIYVGSTAASAVYYGNVKVWESAPADPYNPLGLPPYTIRLKFNDGVTPTFNYGTGVQVSSSPNVWDLTYNNPSWANMLKAQSDLIEVLGANSTGVTGMNYMFNLCSALTTVQLFDTTSNKTMSSMFYQCSSLSTVPLFDTSLVVNIGAAFRDCYAVQSGALALYQQVSTQTTPPTNHSNAFLNCGRDTVTGAAELAQIPTTWGGTMA